MYKIVTSINEFEAMKVKLSVPFKYDGKTIVNIVVDKCEPLYIQTPVCTVPYRCKFYDDGYFQIDLVHQDEGFRELMDDIINKITKKSKTNCKASMSFEQAFKLRNIDVNAIQVFDLNKNKINIKNISKHDTVKAIFQIEHMIIQEESISFGFKVIQIMKCNPSIDHYKETMCLFDQGETILLQRFQKMMSIGVPIQAIRQKMMMEGIDKDQIERIIKKLSDQVAEERVTKLSLPFAEELATKRSPGFAEELAKRLSGGLKLGLSPCPNPNPPVQQKKILRCVDTSKQVPSLSEILKAKGNLKSVQI